MEKEAMQVKQFKRANLKNNLNPLNRYKLKFHVGILKDSHMRYINAGES